jgi:hypothetical protein
MRMCGGACHAIIHTIHAQIYGWGIAVDAIAATARINFTNLTEGILKMAITPEIRPRVTVSAGPEYDVEPMRSAAADSRQDRLESSSSNSIYYALSVLALIVVGYLAYQYYYAPTTIMPTVTNQSTTPVTPPVVPAPSATTPVTPPATTTTP